MAGTVFFWTLMISSTVFLILEFFIIDGFLWIRLIVKAIAVLVFVCTFIVMILAITLGYLSN